MLIWTLPFVGAVVVLGVAWSQRGHRRPILGGEALGYSLMPGGDGDLNGGHSGDPWGGVHGDGHCGELQAEVAGRFHANSAQVQLKAALAGLGIAFLPTLMTRSHLESGRLLQVLPGHGLHGVGVHFVYLSRRELPRAGEALMDFNVGRSRSAAAWMLAPLDAEEASENQGAVMKNRNPGSRQIGR